MNTPNKSKVKHSGSRARVAAGWLVVPCLAGGAWATTSLGGAQTTASAPVPSPEKVTLASTTTVSSPVANSSGPEKMAGYPNVTFEYAPASQSGAKAASSGNAGMVYVKPGQQRPNFGAGQRGAQSAPRISQGTSAAGGIKMEFSRENFPYMRSVRTPDGKIVTQCLEPLNQKIDHTGHNHPTR